MLCVACSGCGPRTRDVVLLNVAGRMCGTFQRDCRFFEATFYPDGRVVLDDGLPENEITAHESSSAYEDLVESLLRRTDFLRTNGDHPLPSAQSLSVTMETNAGFRSVAVIMDRPATDSHAPNALRDWAWTAHTVATGLLATERRRLTTKLEKTDQLARVTYVARGCYGTCSIYSATFAAGGSASIANTDPITRAVTAHRATVPFARVIDALRRAGFAELRRNYGIVANDTFGAELSLRYRDGFSFTSSGPDRFAWSPEFQAVSDRMDQLVRDTSWSPPLPDPKR